MVLETVWGLPETMVTPGCPFVRPGMGAMSYWKLFATSRLITPFAAAARRRKTARPRVNGFSSPPSSVTMPAGMISLLLNQL